MISIKPEDIYKNSEKLQSFEDRMKYALYTLFPLRRLDYKNMRFTTDLNVDKLKDIKVSFYQIQSSLFLMMMNV